MFYACVCVCVCVLISDKRKLKGGRDLDVNNGSDQLSSCPNRNVIARSKAWVFLNRKTDKCGHGVRRRTGVCQNVENRSAMCILCSRRRVDGRGGAHSLQQRAPTGARPWRPDLGAPDPGRRMGPHPHKPHLLLKVSAHRSSSVVSFSNMNWSPTFFSATTVAYCCKEPFSSLTRLLRSCWLRTDSATFCAYPFIRSCYMAFPPNIFHQNLFTNKISTTIFHQSQFSTCLLIVWIFEFRTVYLV